MSQRLIVLTQTLRLPQALGYARSLGDERWLFVVGDPAAIPSDANLPPEQVISTYVGGADPSVAADLSRSIVDRFRRWSRGDSRFKTRVERWARRSEWRFRHVKRLQILLRRQTEARPNAADDSLLITLTKVAEESPIVEIAVFDLFDLPVALRFGREHGIPVIVR